MPGKNLVCKNQRSKIKFKRIKILVQNMYEEKFKENSDLCVIVRVQDKQIND